MLPTVSQNDFNIIRRFPSRQYMHDGELDLIVAILTQCRPKIMIEFGVNVGLTAQAVLKNVASIERYIGIDVLPGYQCILRGQQGEVPINPGFLVLEDERFSLLLRKRGSFDLRPHDLPEADAIFIDGDHSYDAVMNDSALAQQRIRPGGVILWHDYGNPTVEVTAALDDVAMHDGRTILNIEGTWLALEKF